MHPLVVIAIGLGGVFVFWGAYEAADTIYEWYQDRKEQKEYEEYVRMHQEKGRHSTFFEQEIEDEEEEEEDNEPLGIWKQKRDSLNSSSELRQRSVYSQKEHEMNEIPPQYELYEMEKSISEKKSLLERETEILQQQEAELERRKSLLQSRGNSITGVFHDDDTENPFADTASLSFIKQQQKINSSASSSPSNCADQSSSLSSPFDDINANSAASSSSTSSPIQIGTKQQQRTLSASPHQPQHASSDLGGSWSDLNEEEDFSNTHERTNSEESFLHV